jgi:sugar lactone lactonase YvrE
MKGLTETRKTVSVLAAIILLVTAVSFGQEVETVNGLRVVHNPDKGTWGKKAPLTLELVRKIGDVETLDENLAFYFPSDIAWDLEGNYYILDSGNHRIQKFDPVGNYLATFGRQGQGPGEFNYPASVAVDKKGYIYISDPNNQKIQIITPEGKESRTIKMIEGGLGFLKLLPDGQMIMGGQAGIMMGFSLDQEKKVDLPKIFSVLDEEGKPILQFGESFLFESMMVNRMGNQMDYALDDQGNIYVSFVYQNRIEKYSPDGKLLWKADRKLGYSTDPPEDKGRIGGSGGRREIRMPQMNRCSSGIAVDARGRIWVSTLKRQLKEDEQAGTNVGVTMDGAGKRSMSMRAAGNTDVRETDAYFLEVYSPDAVLLGRIQMDHFIDGLTFHGDRLFVLDRLRGTQYFEYKVVEK